MSYQETFVEIPVSDWLDTAARHAREGCRLVHMTGTARGDHYEIMASYDKDYHCINYRTTIPRDNPVLPSLSALLPAAYTYENELKDLFGFTIPGLAVDYGGKFLRTKENIPFSGKIITHTPPPPRAAAPAPPQEP